MQTPPEVMPDRFRIIGFVARDQPGNFTSENVGHRAAVAADRIGIADAFSAIGVTDATADELEGPDFAMRAVGESDRKRDPKEAGLGRRDACHGLPPRVLS